MATRQNYQPYVPPYKRNALKSDESCSDTNSKSENKGGHLLQSLPSKSSEENLASDRNNNKINKSDSFLKRLDSSTLVNNKVSDSDLALVLSCCLLVSLKDSSVNSQNEKESLIHPFHEEKSSVSFRWVSPSQALVVYMNEGIALAYKEKCANPRLSIIQLTVSMAPQYYSGQLKFYQILQFSNVFFISFFHSEFD